MMQQAEILKFEQKAEDLAKILKAIGNAKRLSILCKLAQEDEINVGTLADAVGLSSSALSQHLARMRGEGLVATRRDSQTIWYRMADDKVTDLMKSLYGIYCA